MRPHPPHGVPTTGQQALAEALQASVRLLRILMVLLVVVYLGSGGFTVEQHEKAFVLVLGKIREQGDDRLRGAGLHWTWPRPFSEVVKVPAERVQMVQTERFWTGDEQGPTTRAFGTLTPGRDGYHLSGDANIMHARWILRYVIDDPETYYFKLEDPDTLLQAVLDQSALAAVASTPVDQALRSGLTRLQDEVERHVRQRLIALDAGVTVQAVEVVRATPPGQTIASFNQVIESQVRRAGRISEARAEATNTVNTASAEADQVRGDARTEAAKLRSRVEADAAYVSRIRAQLGDRPELLLYTLRQAALERAFARVKGRNLVSKVPDGEIRIRIAPSRDEHSSEDTP